MPAICLENVSKVYTRTTGRDLLKNHLKGFVRRRRHHHELFYALKDVSFQVQHGESIAILGHNGAGKSTLLSLITGINRPDAGRVQVNGRVSALLELGSGFHPDLTGTENIHLNAALIGLTRKRTEELFEEMVEFSGLSEFIEEPIRTYSTGMVMRLAFSVAVMVDPQILVLDEVLAVGDTSFQSKCIEKVMEFRHAGKTMLCVSHSASALHKMCNRAIWLDHGQLVMEGELEAVADAYEGRMAAQQGA